MSGLKQNWQRGKKEVPEINYFPSDIQIFAEVSLDVAANHSAAE